ncbi:MAG: extracellular solute-binding protein, partial [Acutalibacteraceae bacterium]
ISEYRSIYLSDTLGYYGGILYFYLAQGDNTIVITMEQGNAEINSIVFKQYPQSPEYKTASESFSYSKYAGEAVYFEAETPVKKSDASIYAINDASSTALSPYSPFEKYLNSIGGSSWENPGQYVEWKFSVPEDGLYSLALKYRQDINIGMSSYRKIMIDGKVPYAELEQYAFDYTSTFENEVLAIGEEPILFELEKGEHTLTMEVIIGELSSVLPYVNNVIDTLTADYRKIVTITGNAPDTLRDYNLEEYIPEVLASLEEQKEVLDALIEKANDIMGSYSSGTQNMTILSQQLDSFAEDSYNITKNLSDFKANISSLCTWMLDAKTQPLKLDYFAIKSYDGELKPAQNGFFKNALYTIESFLYTFSSDYEHNQRTKKDDDTITIWMTGSSATFNINDQLIKERFETEHPDINVNLRLVAESLAEAILSGVGPDLYLGIDAATTMNLAYRNAVVDLADFDDFDEVKTRFRKNAFISVSYDDSVYGIPNTQNFSILFYRTDIFEEMGLEPPKTWNDVIYVMSMLKKNNLEFGLPFNSGTFLNMLYQQGETLYNDEQTATALSSSAAINAFSTFTSFFTDYGAPISYNALNRFRTGEMPILVGNVSFAAELDVLAPEIDGKWNVSPYPATILADGTLSGGVVADVTVDIILNEEKKDMCWEYIKWATSADMIVKYNERNEMALGASVRATPANTEAFGMIPWDKNILKIVEDYEKEGIYNIPSVPGSYFTDRHLSNAIKAVVYNSEIPGDALKRYSRSIDTEITNKREYFGLEK